MHQSPYCVVVDGYSSGNFLPPEFRRRGHGVIHVSSTPEVWRILAPTYRPDDYDHHLAFDGDLPKLLDALRPLAPVCVVAGTETGVELADQLSEALRLPGNGTRRSRARRDKFEMIETIRDAGLKAAKQIKARDAETIVRWVEAQGLDRVVVKPLKSAGTDSVTVCHTPDEIRAACTRILGQVNMLGLLNEEVLCQEFLAGVEYALDAVSLDGGAHFTAIWRYYKVRLNDSQFVYDRAELIDGLSPEGQALCAYTRQVLDALEIVQGPSHAEVMLTPNGPALVEIGTRMNGLTTPQLYEACIGYGQLDLTVDSYLNHAAFRAKSAAPYRLKQHAASVDLQSQQEGIVASVPGEALLKALPSYNELRMRAKPGYEMHLTVDYFTSPGFLMLVHPDPEVIQADIAQLREYERTGQLFVLAGDAAPVAK